jgi:hypothetical protein
MSEVTDQNVVIKGYLTWSFLLGMFLIPITMAIFTTDSLQRTTDWTHGDAMILGAIIGIIVTLIAAFPLEMKSR